MPFLRIPFALDDQERVWNPATAEKDRTYYCPACHEPVVLKKGNVKTAHFAHKANDVCTEETITHRIAKLLVRQAVHEWKAGKAGSPIIQRECPVCTTFTGQLLPDKVERAELEHPLSDGSVVDVALIVGDVAAAAVEIRVTHVVEERKAARLPVPFIELDGHEVINNPTNWRPVADHLKPFVCSGCKQTYAKYRAKVTRMAKATGIELPGSYYRCGLAKCWRCKREILVFTWPGHEMFSQTRPNGKPIPKTVQYRYSKGLGKYWVNTCLHCHSIQGDFFLHAEPDGPFFGADCCGEDSPAAFEIDMMRIALNATRNGLLPIVSR